MFLSYILVCNDCKYGIIKNVFCRWQKFKQSQFKRRKKCYDVTIHQKGDFWRFILVFFYFF